MDIPGIPLTPEELAAYCHSQTGRYQLRIALLANVRKDTTDEFLREIYTLEVALSLYIVGRQRIALGQPYTTALVEELYHGDLDLRDYITRISNTQQVRLLQLRGHVAANGGVPERSQ